MPNKTSCKHHPNIMLIPSCWSPWHGSTAPLEVGTTTFFFAFGWVLWPCFCWWLPSLKLTAISNLKIYGTGRRSDFLLGQKVLNFRGKLAVSFRECTPLKTNGWNLKIPPWKRRNIYKLPIFGVPAISFRECKSRFSGLFPLQLGLLNPRGEPKQVLGVPKLGAHGMGPQVTRSLGEIARPFKFIISLGVQRPLNK